MRLEVPRTDQVTVQLPELLTGGKAAHLAQVLIKVLHLLAAALSAEPQAVDGLQSVVTRGDLQRGGAGGLGQVLLALVVAVVAHTKSGIAGRKRGEKSPICTP